MVELLPRAPLGYPDIASLLPHAEPMILLDAVTGWDSQQLRATAQSHLAVLNPLRQEGILSVYAGVEYAAQAQLLHARLTAPAQDNAASHKGFVAVASKLEAQVRELDTVAAPLQIELTQLAANDQSSLYRFSLVAAGQVLLQGELLAVLHAGE